ncbi:MAG: hypothetical protein LBD07_05160 [Spirochaetaceae bacterium]|jgi:hypothetical protein|nr:hypothetical protein [Spirochaetaceae bacterium]
MQKHSLSCFIVTVCDVCRFIALLGIFMSMSASLSNIVDLNTAINRLEIMPFLIYTAPLALFPIMSFFLWQEPQSSRNFARLYIAGKVLSVVASVVWIVRISVPIEDLLLAVRFVKGSQLFFMLAALSIALWDVISIVLVAAAFIRQDKII